MNAKQKYQRRQLNKKIHAAIDEAQKNIALLEDTQDKFFRRIFKRK